MCAKVGLSSDAFFLTLLGFIMFPFSGTFETGGGDFYIIIFGVITYYWIKDT